MERAGGHRRACKGCGELEGHSGGKLVLREMAENFRSGKQGCSQGPSPDISVPAPSGLLLPARRSTLLLAVLIPSPFQQGNPAPASWAPLSFGSAAPAACRPPARLPPSALAAAAWLLPRSADLHHPEICCSCSRACPWHWQQHPSSLLLRLGAAASTAQPSEASPGAGVPTWWQRWHPSLLLPPHPCHPSSTPRPKGWHRDGSRTLQRPTGPGACVYHHLQHPLAPPLPPSLSSSPVLPISSYLLVLTLFSASCPLPSTPPAPFPTSFPALVGGCVGHLLLGAGCVGAGWDPSTPTPPALALPLLHGAAAAPCTKPWVECGAGCCPRCTGLLVLQPCKAKQPWLKMTNPRHGQARLGPLCFALRRRSLAAGMGFVASVWAARPWTASLPVPAWERPGFPARLFGKES